MCELLGMNCNVPTDIQFSLRGFRRRGGETGPHGDGWGIAFYEQRGCRFFHDSSASACSPMAELLQSLPIKSTNVIAHIRKARSGGICIENTHPFHRELWGRTWVFAHNGLLRGIKRRRLTGFRPIGSTDSEHAFCFMLNELQRRFRRLPPLSQLRSALSSLAAELATLGEFNFLLSDSRALFAYCSKKLVYIQRQAPFTRAALADEDFEIDFSSVTTPQDRVVVVATRPLTVNETWTSMAPGTMAVFVDGTAV